MTQRGSNGSAPIGRPPKNRRHEPIALFVLVLFGFTVGGAFYAGIRFEREASKPFIESMRVTEQERDALLAQVAELKQQRIVLERSQQIDREAYGAVSEELKEAQDERLAVEKEVSFLRRLTQDGGGGILQAKDFELIEVGDTGEFGYSFTIRQLIGDFGESVGDVEVKLVGKRDGEETTLPLGKLAGSKPKSHKMKLKHFQTFAGLVRVPDDFEPESLVVEIKPKTVGAVPGSETFPWTPEEKSDRPSD